MLAISGGRAAPRAPLAAALSLFTVALAAAPSAAQGPIVTGGPWTDPAPLSAPPPVVLDNGKVNIEAGINPRTFTGPDSILEPYIELDNLEISGPADKFALRSSRFWEITFCDVTTGQTELTNSTQFSVFPPSDPVIESNGDQVTRYYWLGIETEVLGLSGINVELEVRLLDGKSLIEFRLRVESTKPSAPAEWYVVWGGPAYPIGQDPKYSGDHTLLTPLGDLITDPVGTIGGQPNDNDTYDLLNFSISQVFAFQRDDGSGIWGALLDPTGNELRRVRFHADEAKSTLTAVQGSYMDGIYLDGTLWDDPDTGPDEDLIPALGAHAAFQSTPALFGLIEGDWWDAAAKYRDYFEGTDMAAAGPIATRTDLPDWVKELQGVFVFPTGAKTSFNKGGSGVVSMKEHLLAYTNHFNIEPANICVMFFGLTWTAGGTVGFEFTNIPDYQVSDSTPFDYQAMFAELKAEGFQIGVYIFDSVAVSTSDNYMTKWKPHTLIGKDGEPLKAGTASDVLLTDNDGVLVSPSVQAYQDHMAQVAFDLTNFYDVDLLYLDNFIPTQLDADFSEENGHRPGYGPYQVEGYLDVLKAIVGQDVAVYTEAPQEFYVSAGFMPPYMDFTDLVSKDENVTFVPLVSALYHEFAMLGPARGECFIHGKAGGCDEAYPSITSEDPLEVHSARVSAKYAYALALVNGSSFWIPELASIIPETGWGFESEALYANTEIFDDLVTTLAPMRTALEFIGGLVAYRGAPTAKDYLQLGRRLRDVELELLEDGYPAGLAEVKLVGATVHSGGGINGVEQNDKHKVVQGAWRSPDGIDRGVVLVNYVDTDVVANVTLNGDDRHLQLDDDITYAVQVYDKDGNPLLETPLSMTGTGTLSMTVAMPAETVRLIEISPFGG